MHPNWQRIAQKWPRYNVDGSDERVADISQCVFVGEGKHELVIYTFPRYQRAAIRQATARYPLCIQFGIHYPEFVSEDEPAIGHVRSSLARNLVGLPERAQLLAIIATHNGRACWETLWARLADEPVLDGDSGNSRWILSNLDHVIAAAESVTRSSLPPFIEESPPEFCGVMLSVDDLPPSQFPEYEYSEYELSSARAENWIYLIKQALKKGASGSQPSRERVVLNVDLRRLDDSLFKGQLGWTVPDPGFILRKGSSSLWIEVAFDSGISLTVQVYWLDFVREECAEATSKRIIALHRNTPWDADVEVASRWHRQLPFYVPEEVTVVGRGLEEVYAYTFLSSKEEAREERSEYFPVKIGYTSGVEGALERINGQFPRALANDVRVLFIGRCSNGRATESKIQKHLKLAGRHFRESPGKEWFITNTEEVARLFDIYQ